jgi:hypothetical protein
LLLFAAAGRHVIECDSIIHSTSIEFVSMRERYKVAFGVSCCFSLSLNLAYSCAAHTQDVVSKQFLSSLSTAVAGDLVLLEFMTSLHRGLLDTQLGRIDTEDVNKAGLVEDALFWLLVALSRSAAVITRIAELFPTKVPPPPLSPRRRCRRLPRVNVQPEGFVTASALSSCTHCALL